MGNAVLVSYAPIARDCGVRGNEKLDFSRRFGIHRSTASRYIDYLACRLMTDRFNPHAAAEADLHENARRVKKSSPDALFLRIAAESQDPVEAETARFSAPPRYVSHCPLTDWFAAFTISSTIRRASSTLRASAPAFMSAILTLSSSICPWSVRREAHLARLTTS